MSLSKTFRVILVLSLLLSISSGFLACSNGSGKTRKTVELAPRSKRQFSFQTASSTTISFNTDLDFKTKERCKKNGIAMTWIGGNGEGERVTGNAGGHIKVVPNEGEVRFVVENLEMFPIKVFVSWTAK